MNDSFARFGNRLANWFNKGKSGDNTLDRKEIERICAVMAERNSSSMTSAKYRSDLLYFLANNAGKGRYVCEAGPYKGGLTALLAYACQRLGKKLVICEAVREYAERVKANLDFLGFSSVAEIHVLPFVDFVAQNLLPRETILTIIDANHIYPQALENVRALASVRGNGYAAAFHDFGLKDTDNRMGVDRAVLETFPESVIYRIGESTLFEPSELHTRPAEDKTFFRGSEGALIVFGPESGGRGDFGAAALTRGTYGSFFTLKRDVGVGRAIRETGVWAEPHARLFQKIVKAGDVVIDVGANIGHHSVCFSRLAGPSGKVFAFEPQLPLFKILCANAMINGGSNIYPVRAVVGETPGRALIPALDYESDLNFGAMCVENKEMENERPAGEIPVRRLTLDGFAGDPLNEASPVNFIKLDVQTFELFALRGAAGLLARDKPHLFIEISPYWMKRINNYDYREIYTFLQELGYLFLTPELVEEPGIPDFPLDESSSEIEWDILAIHRNFAPDLALWRSR